MNGDRPHEESFVHEYCKFTEQQESPLPFHLWSALTVLSAAMGRKCYMKKGYYVLYPNLFTVLVAGSALCRKSTAVGLAWDMLAGIDSTLIFRGKITPEKLGEDIEKAQLPDPLTGEIIGPNVLICSSELSVFLTKQSYGEPMIYLLTDLFDCPKEFDVKTKNKGENFLRNVFVSILAATTPDGVAKGIPESALQEGFASRIMFVYCPSTERSNAFPELTANEERLKTRCYDMLKNRARLHGEFVLAPEAKVWYKEWYEDVHKKSQPKDKRLAGFFGRKHDHVLRVGMLFAGSSGAKEVLIGDLEASLQAVEEIEDSARGAFQEIGATIQSTHYARFQQYMRRYKEMHHSLILKMMYPVQAVEFRDIIVTAIESRFITRGTGDKVGMYYYNPEGDEP